MKNIGKIILVAIMTLITAAAGVFGYFFFSGRDYYEFNPSTSQTTNNLTITEGKALVERALNDIININNTTPTSMSLAASKWYDQYEDCDDQSFAMPHLVTNVKVYLQVAKFLMEDEDIKQDTNYVCKLDTNGDYDVNGEFLYCLNFKLKENSVEVYFGTFGPGDMMGQPGSICRNNVLIKIFENKEKQNAWTMDIYTEAITRGTDIIQDHEVNYVRVFAENSKVYRIGSVGYSNSYYPVEYSGSYYYIYDQDRNAKTKCYVTPSSDAQIEEVKQLANSKISEVEFHQWIGTNYVDYNYLDVFREQGDHGGM